MAVLVIGGPTAVGKSNLALEVASQLNAPVVSADAMTIYRELDIGTAKPSDQDLNRVKHYCVNIRSYNEAYTVGDFVNDTHAVIQSHEHVVIAGGTPYYLNALFRPLAPLPESQPDIRSRLELLDNPHERLQQVDLVSAERLHPNDKVRVIRALEVFELTGRPLSEVQKDPPKRLPLDATILWMDRQELRPRIGQRIEVMLDMGYIEECQKVLDEKWDLRSKPLQSFSYKFWLEYLRGEKSFEEAKERTEIGTWHLARKQRTWSRNIGWKPLDPTVARDETVRWLDTLS
jgi:tRNA dimethylallyltransferase